MVLHRLVLGRVWRLARLSIHVHHTCDAPGCGRGGRLGRSCQPGRVSEARAGPCWSGPVHCECEPAAMRGGGVRAPSNTLDAPCAAAASVFAAAGLLDRWRGQGSGGTSSCCWMGSGRAPTPSQSGMARPGAHHTSASFAHLAPTSHHPIISIQYAQPPMQEWARRLAPAVSALHAWSVQSSSACAGPALRALRCRCRCRWLIELAVAG